MNKALGSVDLSHFISLLLQVIAGFENGDTEHAMTALRMGYAMIRIAQSVLVPAEAGVTQTSVDRHFGRVRASQEAKRKSLNAPRVKLEPVGGGEVEETEEEQRCLQVSDRASLTSTSI